jgi:hypothetical protein
LLAQQCSHGHNPKKRKKQRMFYAAHKTPFTIRFQLNSTSCC